MTKILWSFFAALLAYVSADEYSYCTIHHGYNELYDLIRENKCMDVKTMIELLHGIHHTEGKPSCRMHIIHILADHFGPDAETPNFCRCDGKIDLKEYHTHVSDGTNDNKDSCINRHHSYKVLFYKFFESSHSHAGHCRTHDSLWYHLDRINSDGSDHSGCQRDFMMHLKYSFEHHSDHCTCKEVPVPSTHPTTHPTTKISTYPTTQPTTRPTTQLLTRHTTHPNSTSYPTSSGHTGHHNFPELHCLEFKSLRKLFHLGAHDECLSANSVWHYLDDLQTKDPKCREVIQQHLASKYRDANTSSKMSNLCTCRERTELVNHVYHMRNGSYGSCSQSNGTYSTIVSELFSNIRQHGCQNHHVLWPKLEEINNPCAYNNTGTCVVRTDCQQDLVVRASLQYPTYDSDNCVCSKAHVSTSSTPTMTSSTATSQTSSTDATTTTITTTERPAPKIPFACDKIKVLETLVSSLPSTHMNSSSCVTGSSDEAFVLSSCNVTSSSIWKKGANVMVDCESSSPLIPAYTPITTFDSDIYYSNGAQSSIFIGCIGDGIKIATQKCNGIPEIIHIEHGTFQNNPRNYYVIVTNK